MAIECQKDTEIELETNKVEKVPNSFEIKAVGLNQTKSVNQSIVEVVSGKAKATSNSHCNNGDSSPKCETLKPGVELPLNHSRSITDLPSALLSEILNCLDPKDLGVVSCVSTPFYRLSSEHQAWKDFYFERWGQPVGLEPLGPQDAEEKSWKDLFVEKEFRSKTFLGRFSIDPLHGHTEAVRTVFVLASRKVVFTSGYDQTVRMWDLEEGLCIATSRPLGCTIRAVSADVKLLIAGGTDGFIHGWRAVDGNPNLFDIRIQNQNVEFRIWEHEGPITCLALDRSKIYSGSWDMTVRIWDRSSLECVKVLFHNDWIWSLAPHDSTVATASGCDVCIWDTVTGQQLAFINSAHGGNAFCLARNLTGKLLFTGGEDGTINMFQFTGNTGCAVQKIAKWIPHTGPVYSLAFEFPWLVSASSDGKLSLIDVRNLLKRSSHFSSHRFPKVIRFDERNVEPPQRMLHGFGPNLFSVDVGLDRIVCGGEEGIVRVWNFSQALEIEQRIRSLRGLRLENRMRRRKLQTDMSTKNVRNGQCLVAALKNQSGGDRSSWHTRRRVSQKVKA